MERTLKDLAKEAKQRMKSGYWQDVEHRLESEKTLAREKGISESKLERHFRSKVKSEIRGEEPDEFYLKVKELLLGEGEVSDAIGRLTDREYFNTLSYADKQRYNMELSEKYLRALERFKREYEFDFQNAK